MLPTACGFAPGATTVLRLMAEFGRIQPFAGLWHEAQACLLPGMEISSKKMCLPSNSIGSSAAAPADQKNIGVAVTDAMIKDFVFKFIIIILMGVVQSKVTV
jgi:hypothetical protein